MYGKPAITYFKYQVLYLYGSDAITYLNGTLRGYRAITMSHQTAPTPQNRQPFPPVWQNNLHPFGIEL
jgi:hypothetical protein